jgi:hypothetical protein
MKQLTSSMTPGLAVFPCQCRSPGSEAPSPRTTRLVAPPRTGRPHTS